MPTYEYECRSCGHEFEAFQTMAAKPLRKCPKCGKGVKRLIGMGSAIIFRGSGFYQTDYRSKDYTKKAEADKKDSGDSKKPESKKEKTEKPGKPGKRGASSKSLSQ